MNVLLPKFQACLVRTHEAGFHPGYGSFVDKQIKKLQSLLLKILSWKTVRFGMKNAIFDTILYLMVNMLFLMFVVLTS